MNYSNNDIRTQNQSKLPPKVLKRIEQIRELSRRARSYKEKKSFAAVLAAKRLRTAGTTGTLAAFAAIGLVSITEVDAATSFLPPANFDSDAVAGAAEWDFFTVAEGSQGPSSSLSGPNSPTISDFTSNVLVAIESPGGLLGGGDSYYSHGGAYSFDLTATFSMEVSYARVSYALVGGGMGAPSAFPNAPTLTGASLIASGEYGDTNGNTIFYYDFSLESATNELSTSFGDNPAPFSSFRSINGVRIEGLGTAPVTIPEPHTALLLGGASLLFLRRRRVTGPSVI